jgi:hypothetical protein
MVGFISQITSAPEVEIHWRYSIRSNQGGVVAGFRPARKGNLRQANCGGYSERLW